ncbi:MAG: pseudouridine synthase [Phenylobacterium zucineum]|nr:MAG: pseudouridine synthase [Phenylobacterium zucineum]
MNYILRVLIALDQLINVVICNGEPDETMSSVAYRMEQQGRFWGFMRPVIDLLFRPFQKDHCRLAYESEKLKLQLSPEFQK